MIQDSNSWLISDDLSQLIPISVVYFNTKMFPIVPHSALGCMVWLICFTSSYHKNTTFPSGQQFFLLPVNPDQIMHLQTKLFYKFLVRNYQVFLNHALISMNSAPMPYDNKKKTYFDNLKRVLRVINQLNFCSSITSAKIWKNLLAYFLNF